MAAPMMTNTDGGLSKWHGRISSLGKRRSSPPSWQMAESITGVEVMKPSTFHGGALDERLRVLPPLSIGQDTWPMMRKYIKEGGRPIPFWELSEALGEAAAQRVEQGVLEEPRMSPELAIAPPSVSPTPTARIAVPHRNARRSAQEQLEQATMLKEVFAMQDAVNHAAEEAAKQTHKGGPSQLRVLAPLDASALAPPAETLPFLHDGFRLLEDLEQMMYDVEEGKESTAPDEQSLAQSRLLELEELTAQVLSEDSFSLRRRSSAGISIIELLASTFTGETPWDIPNLDDHDGTASYGFPSFYPSFGPSPSPVFSSVLCGLASTTTQPLAGGLGTSSLKRNALPRTEWRPEEDEAIRHGVLKHGYKWRMIACQLPGRSDDAVRNRWSRLSDEGPPSRSPPQHAAEGDSPPSLRQTFRSTSSERSFVGGSSKSDRRISWTQAEDAIIVASVHEMGHQWAKVAERIPSRTEHAIRNRWHRLCKLAEDRVMPPE